MFKTKRMMGLGVLLAGLFALVAVTVAAPHFGVETLPDGSVKLRADDGTDPVADVEVDGDTAVLGTDGNAIIFERVNGHWTEIATLLPDDLVGNSFFGNSVSIHSDTVIIGAFRNTTDKGSESGNAYVFEYTNDVWTQTATLIGDDTAANDWFGSAVSVSENIILVGAPRDSASEDTLFSGSVYVFERIANNWIQTAKFAPANPEAFRNFGNSVSLDGQLGLIGAPFGTNGGSAYLFEKGNDGWGQVTELVGDGVATDDEFGYAVSLYEQTAIVGAPEHPERADSSGSAYVFEETDQGWEQQQQLTPDDGKRYDYFGYDVGIHDNVIVVGAWGDDDTPDGDFFAYPGSAYVFERTQPDGMWAQRQKLMEYSPGTINAFGTSVDVHAGGDTIIIGAFASGNGYIYLPSQLIPPNVISLAPQNNSTNVSPNTDLTLTFTEDVLAGTGNITLKHPDGTVIETIPVTSDRVAINGDTVTIDPATLLAYGTDYAVDIDAGAFEDADGNPFPGLTN